VSEADLYNLTLRSSKKEAIPFRKWVTGEVLPSLRKHASYNIRVINTDGLAPPDAEPLPADKDVQLELFPNTVKLDFRNFSQIHSRLKNCRAWLATEKGKEFPAHDDYLRYLLQEGMKNVGFGG
jgi:prophage antirepressor-like protein